MRKIKKLEIFEDGFTRTYLIIAGIGIGLMLVGKVGQMISRHQEENKQIVYTKEDDKVFEEGEHIIAVPIDDPTEELKEYEGHVGYEPIGISTTGYGKASYHYGTGYILFENTEEVIAHPTDRNKDGYFIYEDFGYPTNPEKEKTTETLYTIEYLPGEHIISVPFSEYKQDLDLQFKNYDGYEPVGMANSTYGQYSEHKYRGCILYTNTETVEKEKDSTEVFGIPKEEPKQKNK